MKQKSFRLTKTLIVTLVMMVITINSVGTMRANALKGPMPTQIKVAWHQLGKVTKTEQKDSEFILHTEANGEKVKLYLTFPKVGGFRLRTDLKGVFDSTENKKIKYSGVSPVRMTAGDTIIEYSSKGSDWSLIVKNSSDRRVLSLTNKQIAFGFQGKELKKVRLEAAISPGETLYGTGERYNSFNQVGNKLMLWNIETMYHNSWNDPDFPTDRSASYKNVPLIHSSRGYTLFFNSTYCCNADLGATNKNKYSLDFSGPKFDFYVWTNSALENIQSYTALTGRPFLPPKWAFGYWAGANEAEWSNPKNGGYLNLTKSMMEKYDELNAVPAALYGEWYPAEDPKAYNIVNEYGTKMLTWNYPHNGHNYLGTWVPYDYPNDEPVVKSKLTPWIKENMLDYTHKNIYDYITVNYRKYWDWGLRGAMLDFGEYVREDMLFSNGMTGDEMHNYYSYWYAKAYYDAWNDALGNDFITFQRSASAGSQKYTANFSGDQASTWAGMKEQLLGILSLSSCGFSVWGGDIGGVWGIPTPELYIRWVQFAAFMPLMRAHGAGIMRDPWNFGDYAVKAFQSSYNVRENLKDAIYSAAVRANKTGVTMVQSMAVAFQSDANLRNNESQYLFANDFLVTPVLSANKYLQEVSLPRGSWYDLWTGIRHSGGKTIKVDAPLNSIPVLVRQGTVTPISLSRDTLEFKENMVEAGSEPALLVTPPDKSRTSTQWESADKSNTFVNKRNSKGYTITAENSEERSVILAHGTVANKVIVDGKPLELLEYRDEVVDYTGYYVDGANRTIIRADSGWKTIEIITGSTEDYTAVSKITDSNGKNLSNLLNSDISKTVSISTADGYSLTVDLCKKVPVSQLILKWSNLGFASDYVVEVSEDGENWELFYEVTEGQGGVDVIRAKTTEARYVRIGEFVKKDSAPMILYEVNVLGASTTAEQIDIDGNDDEEEFKDEEDTDDSDYTESEVPVNSDDGDSSEDDVSKPAGSNGSGKKASNLYAIIIAIAAVIAAGAATAFIIIKKRKKVNI